MTRHYSYLRKLFVVWLIVAMATLSITGYNLYQTKTILAASATFPFDIPATYTFDANRVNVSGGLVTLQSLDQTDDDNTATGFGGGTFSDTSFSGGFLGLDATGLTNGNGTFTSRIIDAGGDVDWNNLDWEPERPIQKELPNNAGVESGYSTGNLSMNGNLLLMHLNETSGTIADSSGNVNTATGTGISYGATGVFDTGIDLGGNGDKIESSTFTYNFTTQLTFAGWFRFSGAGTGSPRILEVSDLGNADSHALAPDGDGSLRAWAECDNGARVGSVDDSTNYNDGQWHHMVYTYSNPTGILYVDGVQTDTASNACANLDDGNELIIGAISDVSGQFTNSQHEFDGLVDELAIWDRALTPTEVQDMYLRGALRQQIQVRSCDDAVCDTEQFIGPDTTTGTFFSELSNSTTFPPSLAMTLSNNRYFQYQVTLETDDNTQNSRFSEISISPSHLDAGSPTIQNTVGIPYTQSLDSFTETLGVSHAGTITYQLSNNGANFYYFDGANWSPAITPAQSNTGGLVSANISTFSNDVGTGSFFFRAFLGSSLGAQTVQLDQIELTFDTGGGGGGGGSSKIFFFPPTAPAGGFDLEINDDNPTTNDQLVSLNFNAGTDVNLVEISNEPEMHDSITLSFKNEQEWDLCSIQGKPQSGECSNGEYTVYARFLTSFGQTPSEIVFDSIQLGEEEPLTEIPPADESPEPEETEIPEETAEQPAEEPEAPTTPPIEDPTPSLPDEGNTPNQLEPEPTTPVEETPPSKQDPRTQPEPENEVAPLPQQQSNQQQTTTPTTEPVTEQVQSVTQETGTNNFLISATLDSPLDDKEQLIVTFLSGALEGQSIFLDEYVANEQEVFFYTPLEVNPSKGDLIKVSTGTIFKKDKFVSPESSQPPRGDVIISEPNTTSLFTSLQIVIGIGFVLGIFILFSLWKQNVALTTLIEHEHSKLYHRKKRKK